ncbi:hypothetical protein LTR05_005839 [Lithohypha guttulata]|uniref:Uncharacterized protein n=1 Tax=Lithohypha guttulata TaxID=1690604 RepID=A0AAN7SZ44_9EURO|nr:hypothetical protein LTR05_005839 [Lithohypha guttulata]
MEKHETQIGSSEVRPDSEHSQAAVVPTAAAWPTQPKPLVLSKWERNLWLAYDIFLVFMPVALIVKTGLVILAWKLDSGNSGSYFDQASQLSWYLVSFNSQLVTLFTIIFVTIISTCVKRYALWKAQKGAYLSELEQLQGSVSLPSTLKLIWSLRSFSTMSACLVCIWAFYYLGSQAAKEEYVASNSDAIKDRYAFVQRPDGPTIFDSGVNDFLNSSGASNVTYATYRDLNYRFANALLLKGDMTRRRDDPTAGTNDGPLIPDLDSVIAAHDPGSTLNKVVTHVTGWIDVSQQSKNQYLYTSHQGVSPLLASWTPKNKDDLSYYDQQILGSYELSTSYLSVACSDLEALPVDMFPNGTSYNSSVSLNVTSYRPDAPRDAAGHALREFEYWYRTSMLVNATVERFEGGGFQIIGGVSQNFALRGVCNVTTKNIDLKVSCVTTGCYPHAMRWHNNTNATAATSYSTPFDSLEFGNNFLSNLTLSTGPAFDWVMDAPLVYNYLSTSGTGLYNTSDPSAWIGTPPALSMTQVFNTYLTLSQSMIQQYMPQDIAAIMEKGSDAVNMKLTVDGAPFVRAYRIDWRWVPIDFISSAILLAAAIASWWLRTKTLAPDIFGYVSSLTRDNEHVPLPTEGSMLSGIDRARMLKNVKVKIGDLGAGPSTHEGNVGRIGLAPADASVSGLRQERLYV